MVWCGIIGRCRRPWWLTQRVGRRATVGVGAAERCAVSPSRWVRVSVAFLLEAEYEAGAGPHRCAGRRSCARDADGIKERTVGVSRRGFRRLVEARRGCSGTADPTFLR